MQYSSDLNTGTTLNPSAAQRHQMLMLAGARMRELAHRALYVHNLDPASFVVICIAVDSRWRPLVECVMPDSDDEWQKARENGNQPVALGIVRGLNRLIACQLPKLRGPLEEAPAFGKVKAAILDDNGGTVYEIEPFCESQAH